MVKVLDVADGEDPRPLYVVPWIPDAIELADLSAFREKVRAEVLSRLGRSTIPSNLTIGFSEVLDSVSHGIYLHWRHKDSLHGRVFRLLGAWTRSLTAGDSTVTLRNDALDVNLQSDADRERLMETVRTAALPERAPQGYQPDMFDPSSDNSQT